MSAQKRLSQLSVAAVALLVVALPCFAQTETITNQTENTSMSDAGSVVAVNRETLTRESRMEAKRAADADTMSKAPKFSADKLVKAVNESPTLTFKSSSGFRPAMPNNFEQKSSKRIAFAPSVKPAAPGVTQ